MASTAASGVAGESPLGDGELALPGGSAASSAAAGGMAGEPSRDGHAPAPRRGGAREQFDPTAHGMSNCGGWRGQCWGLASTSVRNKKRHKPRAPLLRPIEGKPHLGLPYPSLSVNHTNVRALARQRNLMWAFPSFGCLLQDPQQQVLAFRYAPRRVQVLLTLLACLAGCLVMSCCCLCCSDAQGLLQLCATFVAAITFVAAMHKAYCSYAQG